MKTASRIFLLALSFATWAAADIPKKAPITKYIGLWTKSPFTDPPLPPEAPETVNPFEDLALLGVAPIRSGYRVTMVNKKKPEERITVISDDEKSDYKILEVTRKPFDPFGTVVRLQSGKITGSVSVDEKLLVLATPKAAPKPQPGAPGAPGSPGAPVANMPPTQNAQAQQAAQASQNAASSRQPRPRVVPPSPSAGPMSGGGPTSQGSQSGSHSRGGRGSYGR